MADDVLTELDDDLLGRIRSVEQLIEPFFRSKNGGEDRTEKDLSPEENLTYVGLRNRLAGLREAEQLVAQRIPTA